MLKRATAADVERAELMLNGAGDRCGCSSTADTVDDDNVDGGGVSTTTTASSTTTATA